MNNPLFKKNANGFDTPAGMGKTHYTGFYPEAVGGGWNPMTDNDNLSGEISNQMGGYAAGTRGADKVQGFIDGLYRGTQEPPTKSKEKKPTTGMKFNASKTATGEMSREECTPENYPIHFAIAKAVGGTVEPFDVYQGPYIDTDQGRLFINVEEGGMATVWNEETTNESNTFYHDDENGAVEAALSVLPNPPENTKPHGSELLQQKALKSKKPVTFAVGDKVDDGGRVGWIVSPARHATPGEAWMIRYTDGSEETAGVENLRKLKQDKKIRKTPEFSEEDKISLHGLGVKGSFKAAWDKAISRGLLKFESNRYSFSKDASVAVREAFKDTVVKVNSSLNRRHIPKSAAAHEAAVKTIAERITQDNHKLDKMSSLAKAAAKATHVIYAASPKGYTVRVMRGSVTIDERSGSETKSAVALAAHIAGEYGVPMNMVKEASSPKCPHCGSTEYSLMPTDFETAKCKECGKNWEHGIVDGINNPYDKKATFSPKPEKKEASRKTAANYSADGCKPTGVSPKTGAVIFNYDNSVTDRFIFHEDMVAANQLRYDETPKGYIYTKGYGDKTLNIDCNSGAYDDEAVDDVAYELFDIYPELKDWKVIVSPRYGYVYKGVFSAPAPSKGIQTEPEEETQGWERPLYASAKTATWEDGQFNEDCPLPPRQRCNEADADICCGGGAGEPCTCKTCHPPLMGTDHPHAEFVQKRFNTVSSQKTANMYSVEKSPNEGWYIKGLPSMGWDNGGEDKEYPNTTIVPGMNHSLDTPSSLAQGIYEELYTALQTNDNLQEGDIFVTPVGQFLCQGVHVLPYDEKAKAAIAEVDEQYKCSNCGCDQGDHRAVPDGEFTDYMECRNHPTECREFKTRTANEFKSAFLKKALPSTHRLSLQEAQDRGMFGPVYHGTSVDNWEKIDLEGFKVIEGDTGSAGISNGYAGTREYAQGIPAPVHHLGFGTYLTTVKSIAKMFNGGTTKGLRTFYLDVPRLETINFASPNTMMKWWIKNGYNPNVAKRDRVTATKLMTEHLKAQFDAVWYKGKTIRKVLDGDQIVVFDPSRIYEIDTKLAKPGEVGSKVTRKSDGMKGVIIGIRNIRQEYAHLHNGQTRFLEVKWQKGGREWNVYDSDVDFA